MKGQIIMITKTKLTDELLDYDEDEVIDIGKMMREHPIPLHTVTFVKLKEINIDDTFQGRVLNKSVYRFLLL